jgi:hypothetical protein
METALFPMINVEIPMIVAEEHAEAAEGVALLDDAQLRHVGGGIVVVALY